jgi:hypothetical protein
MAKYDPDRIAETAEPYAPGTSGIEPLCDEQGRMVLAPGSGGGGGSGGATEAKQDDTLNALDAIYDALQLVGLDATSVQIRDAVTALGAGATLVDLATAFATDAITQGDILVALEASGIDIALIKSGIDLLVPDLDDVRIATQATAAATGTTGDADTSSTLVGLLKWIKARLPFGPPTFEASYAASFRGKISYCVNVIGRRATFTANVLNDVVSFAFASGTSIPEMAGTEALEIVSTSANDTAAGTGARTVTITYIDAQNTIGAQVTSAAITLNGTTPVALGASIRALAIQWAEAATVGSGGVAAGDITIRNVAAPTTIYEQINAGGNRSLSGRYMVPVGYSAYCETWTGAAIAQDMDIRLRATVAMGSRAITAPYLFQDAMYPAANNVSPSRHLPWLKFPALSKIKLSAMPPAVSGSPRVEGSFSFIVIEN